MIRLRRAEHAALPFDYFLRQRTSSFRTRLTVSAVLSVVVIAGVSGLLAVRQYQHAQRTAATDLEARAVVAAAVVDASFAGQISTLNSIAAAPAVVGVHTADMGTYFKRVERGAPPFNGGLGWIDRSGALRVSSTPGPTASINLSSRTYFQQVLKTGAPYVSAGLIGARNGQEVIVTAVATHDTAGRISGVLAGSTRVKAISQNKASLELGFAGLSIVDRSNHQLFSRLSPVDNVALLKRIKGRSGVETGVSGLAGHDGDVVAFAAARLPGWTIVIDRSEGSVYAAARRSLVLELGSVAAALLVVFALLAFVTRRSRRQTDDYESRARAWSGLTRTLAAAATPADVTDALISSLMAAFPAGLPVVSLVSEEGDLRVRATQGDAWTRVTANDSAMAEIALYAREARHNVRLDREPLLIDVHRLSGRRLRWFSGLPVTNPEGGTIGSLALLSPVGPLGESEWGLLTSFAEQVGQAVERTLLYEREHDLAVSLQHSLLPEALPSIDGIDLAGHYAAGGTGVEVGGDWYDAVRRPDGIVHLSVGDVIGKGIGAAMLMGRHRNAFRAYAYECASPAEIVRRMIRHVDSDEMIITVACVTLDPYTRQLTYACAGHLPPLLIDDDQHVAVRLDGASAPPLGVAEPHDIDEASLHLTGHRTVVMYTDGLIERRGHNIDAGIDLLANLFAESDSLSIDSTLRVVEGALGAPTDDVALLVARLTQAAQRFDVHVPARPDELPTLRRRLKAWLTEKGLEASLVSEVVLAVGEACNNAVEHAYDQRAGDLWVKVVEEAGMLRITIEDRGAWRPETVDDLRGRGISIMETLMDDVRIETTPHGTRVHLERRLAPALAAVPQPDLH